MQEVLSFSSKESHPALIQIAIWAAYASGVAAGIGLVFLVVFFSGISAFGLFNDVAVIIQYIMLLPISLTVWQLLKTQVARWNDIALVIGWLSFTAVIILQSMLVLDVIPFNRQIVLVIPAFLVGMLWFVMTGYLGRKDERIPKGTILHILAGLVFAYPIWAFRFANNLQISVQGAR